MAYKYQRIYGSENLCGKVNNEKKETFLKENSVAVPEYGYMDIYISSFKLT